MSNNQIRKPEAMAEFFDVRANSYDNHMKGLDWSVSFEHFYNLVSRPILQTKEPINVLDLGCGTGLELERVFAKAPNALITGIDLSAGMMSQLREKYSNYAEQLTLIQASYLEHPFGVTCFDYAVSVQSVHHFLHDTKRELYTKIRKALKPGGMYIEGDYMVSEVLEQELLQAYHQKMNQIGSEQTGSHHIDIPFSLKTQTQLFFAAGFTSVEVLWQDENSGILVAHTKKIGS